MKKILNLFICMLTVVLGFGMALANPAINVVQAIEAINTTIANSRGTVVFGSIKMPTSVDAKLDTEKTGFFIPYPSVSDLSAVVKINVTDGKNTFTFTVGDGNTNYFKTASETLSSGVTKTGVYFQYNTGTTYNVYYTAKVEDKEYSSSIYEVKVTNVAHTLDLTDLNYVPETVGVGDKILIPTLSIKDSEDSVDLKVINNSQVLSEGEELIVEDGKTYLKPASVGTYTLRYTSTRYNLRKDFDIDVSETFNSSKVKLEAETLTMKSAELGEEVTFPKANVTDTYHQLKNVKYNVVITIVDENDNETTLEPNVYTYTFNKVGSYTIKYSITNLYLDNQKTLETQIKDQVVVSDTKAPVVSFVEDYQTTGEDWEESVKILGDYIVPTKVGYNGMKFPALYAKDLGTKYNDFTDLQRLLISNSGEEFDIDNPEDNASLDSNYEKDVTKSINFTFHKLENETDDEYLTRIKGSYTLTYRAVETVGVNNVERKSGEKRVSVYIMGVDAPSYTDDTNLTITLPTIQSQIKSNETISVKVSPAKDDEDKAIETHYYAYYGRKSVFETAYDNARETDEGTQEKAKYAYGFNSFYNTFNGTNTLYELTCEDSKLEIALQEYNSSEYVTVVAVAINDQGQFVYDSKEIKVKNETTDFDLPTVDESSIGSFDKTEYKLGQDKEVKIPSITFSDADDELYISVQYYIDNIKNGLRPVNGGITYTSEGKTTFSNGVINPTQAGTYYVVYTARDDANNIVDIVSSFVVTEETVYSVKVECETSLDIYDSTNIDAYVVDDKGNRVDDADVKINFNGISPSSEGTVYTFNYAGTYSFVATTNYDGKDLSSGVVTITVKDVAFVWNDESNITVPTTSEISPATEYQVLTSEPSDWATNYTDYYIYESSNYVHVSGESAPQFETNKYFKKNELVYVQLTVPTANQNGHDRLADVVVKDPNGDIVELIEIEIEGIKTGDVKFLAEKDGRYTITYSVGSGDNKISKTFNCQVGDNNKPFISLSNKTNLQKDLVYKNKEITYTMSYAIDPNNTKTDENVYKVTFKAVDEDRTLMDVTVSMRLYDIDRNGVKKALTWSEAIKSGNITLNGSTPSNVSSNQYKWTISSVDDYTISIVAQDTKGNKSTAEIIKFSVVDKENVKEKDDNKVGIILIVLSIIVLAGIVCYFAFAGKSPATVSKKSKETKVEEKKSDDKENQ